jgi:hypothetical protein
MNGQNKAWFPAKRYGIGRIRDSGAVEKVPVGFLLPKRTESRQCK